MKPAYWKWDNAISPEMCDMLLQHRKQLVETQGKVGDAALTLAKPLSEVRDSKVCWCDTNHWAESILYNHALYANERAGWMFFTGRPEQVQLAEYSNGGFYDWHTDWFPLDDQPTVRKLSVVALLSDPKDFKGGEFQFSEVESINLQRGSIIVFPSFLQHRVTPVTEGVRYSAVCWVLGPKTL